MTSIAKIPSMKVTPRIKQHAPVAAGYCKLALAAMFQLVDKAVIALPRASMRPRNVKGKMKDVVFYQCATCPHQKEYNSRQSYERHFVAKHVHNSVLICQFPNCVAVHSQMAGLEAHTCKDHTDERPNHCYYCPKNCHTSAALTIHRQSKHPGMPARQREVIQVHAVDNTSPGDVACVSPASSSATMVECVSPGSSPATLNLPKLSFVPLDQHTPPIHVGFHLRPVSWERPPARRTADADHLSVRFHPYHNSRPRRSAAQSIPALPPAGRRIAVHELLN